MYATALWDQLVAVFKCFLACARFFVTIVWPSLSITVQCFQQSCRAHSVRTMASLIAILFFRILLRSTPFYVFRSCLFYFIFAAKLRLLMGVFTINVTQFYVSGFLALHIFNWNELLEVTVWLQSKVEYCINQNKILSHFAPKGHFAYGSSCWLNCLKRFVSAWCVMSCRRCCKKIALLLSILFTSEKNFFLGNVSWKWNCCSS